MGEIATTEIVQEEQNGSFVTDFGLSHFAREIFVPFNPFSPGFQSLTVRIIQCYLHTGVLPNLNGATRNPYF